MSNLSVGATESSSDHALRPISPFLLGRFQSSGFLSIDLISCHVNFTEVRFCVYVEIFLLSTLMCSFQH